MMKVPIEQAVGLALGHDITEIDPDRGVKRRAFRRGHVVGVADLDLLRRLGKRSVFVLEPGAGEVHEDEAALMVAPLAAGPNVAFDPEPCEGRIGFRAACRGLFLVDPERLYRINDLQIPSLPTLPTHTPVEQGQLVAAFRIIPLTCTPEIMTQVKDLLREPLLQVQPYVLGRAGIVVTGNEVAGGRVKDGFIPRLGATLAGYGVPVTATAVVPDDLGLIAEAVRRLAAVCDILLITGGTSVDPDNVTVEAMAAAGVQMLAKGMPVQPGNHFTLGSLDGVPVCAVPAAALHYRITALDLILPRLLAGIPVTREQIARLGHGGLAQPGAQEHFPDCTFGTGG